MPVWPTDPSVRLTPQSHSSRDKSHTVRLTNIEMGSHTGTHIDAPWHFVPDGRRLNEIPLSTLVGQATVFEIPDVPSIGAKEVAALPLKDTERVLFKTSNSRHWNDGQFFERFVYLEPDAAQMLADEGIKLVGIDYLSVDRFKSEKHPTHFILLERDIVILEGLNLSAVPAGVYRMVALPLNLQDADGAPTRVILEDIDED